MKLVIRNNEGHTIKVIDFVNYYICENGKLQIPVSYCESLTLNNPEVLSRRIVILEKDNQHVIDFFDGITDHNTVNPLVREYTGFESIDEMINCTNHIEFGNINPDDEITCFEVNKIMKYYNKLQKEQGSSKRLYEFA